MPRKCTQEKISMEPILQDLSVSSLTDFNPDFLPPSDSSLIMTVADYEVVNVANMSLNHTVSSASYPADSTIMENILNKPQGHLFKKPFNVKYTNKPRASLFDSDMKDSEPETPEQKLCRPFQRKKRRSFKENVPENESSNTNCNLFIKGKELSNLPQNLRNTRKNKIVENSLFDKSVSSESDSSFSTEPVFQRKKTNQVKKNPAAFHDVFEQSSDSSYNILPDANQTSENCQVGNQEKLEYTYDYSLKKSLGKTAIPHDIVPGKMNFITRRKAKQNVLIESNIFDKDILTSESDESFSLKPALKKHRVVKKVNKSTLFDDALESIDTLNLSTVKSPTLKRLPFKTNMKTRSKDQPGFDSLLNESLDKSENKNSRSRDMPVKRFSKEVAEDSINFDDIINNTCDESRSMSNSLMIEDICYENEAKTLPVNKTNASKNSLQLSFENQTELDVSNKTEELDISCSMKFSKLSDVNNKREMILLFNTEDTNNISVQESHENIEEYSGKIPSEYLKEFSTDKITTGVEDNEKLTVLEDQEACVEPSCVKDCCSDSKNSPTNLNLMEEVSNSLKDCSEANSSKICSKENCAINLTCSIQDEAFNDSELKHKLQGKSLVRELIKNKHEGNSRVIDYNSKDVSNLETSNNRSFLEQTITIFNGNETDNDYEKSSAQEGPGSKEDCINSTVQIPRFNANHGESFDSDSKCSKSNKVSGKLSNCVEKSNQSLTSFSKIKKKNVKRVSFKIGNEDERKTDRNSAANNTSEEKSYSRCNQSHNFNTTCSLESLVFDGSSSEITSGSVFIDLCASRNKSSSVNMNVDSNDCQTDHVNNSLVAQPHNEEEIDESTEEGGNKKIDNCSLEDLDDGLEADSPDERESVEIEEQDGLEEKQIGDSEENYDEVDIQEPEVEEKVSFESAKDRSADFDEQFLSKKMTETLNGSFELTPCETEESLEENENALLQCDNRVLKLPNNVPVNVHNYQFKKPGSCTVLNEKISTPPTKRKVKEMLAKIPLSELRRKKSKPVVDAVTKGQMEQDKIEEMLRKRQKLSEVQTTKSAHLIKPKLMSYKIYDFIIEKLTPNYGIKSRIEAENIVLFLNEQVDVIMKKENKLVQTVKDMKMRLAHYEIIRTHWDFYKFIMNYFDGFFTQKVYPSGVVSPFEPDDPFQDIFG